MHVEGRLVYGKTWYRSYSIDQTACGRVAEFTGHGHAGTKLPGPRHFKPYRKDELKVYSFDDVTVLAPSRSLARDLYAEVGS